MRSIPPITRETTHLLLRPLAAEDERDFVHLVETSREAWAPWTPAGDPGLDPAERFRREVTRGARGRASGTHLRLAAFDRTGELIGFFALNEIVRGVFQSCYASWQVGVTRMGEGLGTEGVAGLLEVAFAEPTDGLGLHRVQANVMPRNAASMRIAEKVGFRREGLAIRYLKIAGAWEDHVMHALTREEWRDAD